MTDFTLATEQVQLITEMGLIHNKSDQSELLFAQQAKSPMSQLKSYCFTQNYKDKQHPNGTISIITNKRSSLNEDFLNSVQQEQLRVFEHRQFNPGNQFAYIDNIKTEQNDDEINSILQIKIDHSVDIFEFFEKEESYNAIEIIDYESFLTIAEFALIDEQLRNLSKKFKALRITNVELTAQHLKILEFGLLSKRTDLEIQFNNNNIDDHMFFQFLMESHCYKIFQFINNIGILKFIGQIYSKHQTQSGRAKNQIRISAYNVLLERSEDDLVLTLHTGQNQFFYLTSTEEFKLKYPVVNYDLKSCPDQIINNILSCSFARIHLPQIQYLSMKIEKWNLQMSAEAIFKTKTINTLDLSGSDILSDANMTRTFFKERKFKIKELILRNIQFSNPSFKSFVQHFLYSDFTTLKTLDISDCGINDEKIYLLCENIRLRQDKITLEQLYLSKNPLIGDEGWRRLFSLLIFGKCANITDLDIRGCLLTSKHLKEGIIQGMKLSQRFKRKFCIRFPLKRFFISSSEMSAESWKILITEFIFNSKMGLTHFNCFFTGNFMANSILVNQQLNLEYPESVSTYNQGTSAINCSSRFNPNLQNQQKSTYYANQTGSYASSPSQINLQGHATSFGVISHQYKVATQSSGSSDSTIQVTNKAGNKKQQNSSLKSIEQQNLLLDSNIFNAAVQNKFDDSVISSENEKDNINQHQNNSFNNINSNNNNNIQSHYNATSQAQTLLKSPSQTQITQAQNMKSFFSKESLYKQQQLNLKKSATGSGSGPLSAGKVQLSSQEIPSLNLKNNSNISAVSPIVAKVNPQGPQYQRPSFNTLQNSPYGANSLESFKSFKSKTTIKNIEINEDSLEKNNNIERDQILNIPQHQDIEFKKNNYVDQEQTIDFDQSQLNFINHERNNNDTNLTKQTSKDQSLFMLGPRVNQGQMNDVENNNTFGQFPSTQAQVKKSASLKNVNNIEQVDPESFGRRQQWQKVNSYSHQKIQKELGSNNILRSITNNSPKQNINNSEENAKYNVKNGSFASFQKDETNTLKILLKKNSEKQNHAKNNQEIMDSINFEIQAEGLKHTSPMVNGSPQLYINSKSQNDQNSSIRQTTSLNQQSMITVDKLSLEKKQSQEIEDYDRVSSDGIQVDNIVQQGNTIFQFPNEECSENTDNTLIKKQQKSTLFLQDMGQSPNTKSSPKIPLSDDNNIKNEVQNKFRSLSQNLNPQKLDLNEQENIKTINGQFQEEENKSILNSGQKIIVPPIKFPASHYENNQKDEIQSKTYKEKLKQDDDGEKDDEGMIKNKKHQQRLTIKQSQVIEKVKKKNKFLKQIRKNNIAGIIRKQDVVGTVENAIFKMFEGFLNVKRNFLQQIIFHTTESMPYLSNDISKSASLDFQGNIQNSIIQLDSNFVEMVQKLLDLNQQQNE